MKKETGSMETSSPTNRIKLRHYAAAGYPAVALATADEDRAITQIISDFPQREIYRIAALGGLQDARTGKLINEKCSYPEAFQFAGARPRRLLIVLDFQHAIKNPGAYRALRDALPACKSEGTGSLIVLLAPTWQMPAELAHDLQVMDDSLPSRAELAAALAVCTKATDTTLTEAETAALIDAGCGMTLAEFENSAALSFAANEGRYDVETITNEKMRVVRSGGFMSVMAPADPATLGGLGELHKAIREEILPSLTDPELRDVMVTAVALTGCPGTGKTLASRVIAGTLGWPLLDVSIPLLKGSLVGASEARLKLVLDTAEAVAPCVFRLDEIEKGVAGHTSGGGDAGVSSGMVSILLTRFQTWKDNGTRVLVVATSNDYSKIPAELARRFDLQFFVDQPSRPERIEIAGVHLVRYVPLAGPKEAEAIADLTDGWTGAEIEQLVRSAARRGRTAAKFPASIETAAAHIKPQSKTREAEISKLREWGRANLRLANTEETAARPSGRGVKVARPDRDSIFPDAKGGSA
jgi:hypothetical protein